MKKKKKTKTTKYIFYGFIFHLCFPVLSFAFFFLFVFFRFLAIHTPKKTDFVFIFSFLNSNHTHSHIHTHTHTQNGTNLNNLQISHLYCLSLFPCFQCNQPEGRKQRNTNNKHPKMIQFLLIKCIHIPNVQNIYIFRNHKINLARPNFSFVQFACEQMFTRISSRARHSSEKGHSVWGQFTFAVLIRVR